MNFPIFSPLRKMTLGMILAGVSFILAALVQLQMDVSTQLVQYRIVMRSLSIDFQSRKL